MNQELFRKEALDAIETPEGLNAMVKITTTRGWLSLLAVFLIITFLIVWSIIGNIPRIVNGQGILLQAGGIKEISAISEGKVENTLYDLGDFVKKGDVIAYIAQPSIKMQIKHTREHLDDIYKRYRNIAEFGEENLEMNQKLLLQEEINLNNQIENNNQQLHYIQERIKAQEALLKKGLVTKESLNSTKQLYYSIQQENDRLLNEMNQIKIKLFEYNKDNQIQLQEFQSEILELTNKIDELTAIYELDSKIESPVTGRVIEVMVNPGQMISPGTIIMSIEPEIIEQDIEAIVYVNPGEGKKVERGMEVKLSPATVEVEEYGYIIGKVLQVSKYPATKQGMLRTLGNPDLVNTFAQNAPPIAVRVLLNKDSLTYSGFQWTTKNGPPIEIKAGTLCKTKIVVETQKPIHFLFPKIASLNIKKKKGKLN